MGRQRGWWTEKHGIRPLIGQPQGPNKTLLAWIIAIVGLLVYEGYTLLNSVPGDTLSEAVWVVSHDYPLVPFAAGVIIGHFFWQRRVR